MRLEVYDKKMVHFGFGTGSSVSVDTTAGICALGADTAGDQSSYISEWHDKTDN